MSILNSNYEISVWEDRLEDGVFEEVRLGVIGSDQLATQSKVFEPNLSQKTNGEKKLSFKLYKRYIDNITGEQVENPFYNWLINERKVKLYYKDTWYDFIIKNIVENSSTYLYTYQLEDANIQELSKNGFGVTFDAELMNNLGTAKKLAEDTLKDTDWDVESEVFIEKVEDRLVYVYSPNAETTVTNIIDQTSTAAGLTFIPKTLKSKTLCLAFYSSCKNKPHRFQFIKLDSYARAAVKVDEKSNILEADCQYFTEVAIPESDYSYNETYDMYLPTGWSVAPQTGADGTSLLDTTISWWYQAKRYGFSQETIYVPLLKRYCNVYKDAAGGSYYGYIDSNYTSPTLIQDMITNGDFNGIKGWTGTYVGNESNAKTEYGAEVESVYGKFVGTQFETVEEAIRTGSYDQKQIASYSPYLKIKFGSYNKDNLSTVLNSCVYDNRHFIKKFTPSEQWILECDVYNSQNISYSKSELYNDFSFELCDVGYNTAKGNYTIKKKYGSATAETGKDYLTFTINKAEDDEEEWNEANFLKKNIRLVIQPCGPEVDNEIYIKNIKLYKKVVKGNTIIQPGVVSNEEIDGVVENVVCLVEEDKVKASTKVDELSFTEINQKVFNLNTWKPVYTSIDGHHGEKRRTISIKESNYFNILQTIAETFECWLDIEVKRDASGGITKKKVKFKNYAGNTNYAAFRYGVNLKDIQRTFESKKIATKLVVKQNSNELAKDGFCTIARANSNPTGENYIYDFQYFHAKDLLDSEKYVAEMYYSTNPLNGNAPSGKDVDSSHTTWNTQNYFARLKDLNNQLTLINDQLAGVNTELIKLNAEKSLQEQKVEAAASSLEETVEEFITLVGTEPTNVADDKTKKITLNDIAIESVREANEDLLNGYDGSLSIIGTQIGTEKSPNWEFKVKTESGEYNESSVVLSKDHITYDSRNFTITAPFYNNKVSIIKFTIDSAIDDDIYIYQLSFPTKEYTELKIRVKEDEKIFTTSKRDYIINYPGSSKFEVEATFIYNSSVEKIVPFEVQVNKKLIDTEVFAANITGVSCHYHKFTPTYTTRTLIIPATFIIDNQLGSDISREAEIHCTIPPWTFEWETNYCVSKIDTENSTISKLLSEYIQYQKDYQDATNKLNGIEGTTGLIADYTVKETQFNNLKAARQDILDIKQALNKTFYNKYSRFIQEGTWISEDYVDDEKYYNDACSVLYNSCYPQVAYTINVLALENLPGYEGFEFKLGDTTYAEDPDFFGTDKRIEVIITEISENLDDNSSRKIKVQNFKNQFQDLFQKITATTQQVEYNTGAYEKAVALAEANAEIKGQFLSDALSGMASKLSVAGQTDVVQDYSGLTLTDSNTKDQMKLTGGAILMSVEDPDTGERKWKTGLTPEGISASLVTAGTINSSEVAIMNANDPVFRWDAFGISAYDADWNGDSITTKANPYKFVRFDKHGVYGIGKQEGAEGAVDGSIWKPSSLDEIKEKSTFALTWDGLFLNLGDAFYNKKHSYIPKNNENNTGDSMGPTETLAEPKWHGSQTKIGKAGNYIYNSWVESPSSDLYGSPYYDSSDAAKKNKEFVKVFSVGETDGNENLVVYDDGTLVAKDVKFTGNVQWVKSASPSQTVYGHVSLTTPPQDGTSYGSFEENDYPQDGETLNQHRWHTRKGQDDTVYSKTDTGGGQWDGPFLITGRSIEGTETEYLVGDFSSEPGSLEGWNPTFPGSIASGKYLYTRVKDKYNDGTSSSWRYTVSYNGLDGGSAIICYVESSLGVFINKKLDGNTSIRLTARIFDNGQEIDAEGNNLDYTWYVGSTPQTIKEEITKYWDTTLQVIREQQIHFTADVKNPQ